MERCVSFLFQKGFVDAVEFIVVGVLLYFDVLCFCFVDLLSAGFVDVMPELFIGLSKVNNACDMVFYEREIGVLGFIFTELKGDEGALLYIKRSVSVVYFFSVEDKHLFLYDDAVSVLI